VKNIFLILLAALCLYLFADGKLKESRIFVLAAQNATLEDGLSRQITLQGRKIIYKERGGQGIEMKTLYLPPEGSLDIRQYEEGTFKITVQNKGMTLRPFAAFLAADNGRFEPALGARFLYWNRYGLGAAWAAQSGIILAADRRLDDVAPFTQNTSALIFAGRQTLGLGLAVYF